MRHHDATTNPLDHDVTFTGTPGRHTLTDRLTPHPDAPPIQRRAAGDAAAVPELRAREQLSCDVLGAGSYGISEGGGALPHGAAIQRSFGRHDVSNVQAHVGGAAARASDAMGAEAYATGDHVAFRASPSLHLAAHEAAHVVQQRAGVHLKGGVGAEGDVHERHADAVADLVVQGRSAEALLDQHAGGGGGGGARAASGGAVQMRGANPAEQRQDVARGTTNTFNNIDSLQDRQDKGLLSRNGMNEALDQTYARPDDQNRLELNTQFEVHLQHHLEHPATEIAKQMSLTIGGYQSFEGAKDYIAQNLESDDQDVERSAHQVGNEQELIDWLNTSRMMREIPRRGAYVVGPAASLDVARAKVEFLKAFKGAVDGLAQAPVWIDTKKLFRKIFYTAKLDEMLLSQMGYFGGSLEFKAGLEDDLEYWVYLMSTKTRGPEAQMLDDAPKPMNAYHTESGHRNPLENSLLPWHNQFSMSLGHAEFDDADALPEGHRAAMEQKLAEFQQTPENITTIDQLAAPAHRAGDTWTLAELMPLNETKKKALFTDLLRLSWSTTDYTDGENPFRGRWDERRSLDPGDIRDPRIHEEAQRFGTAPQDQLGISSTRSHVVGGKANILLTPESASYLFQRRLARMSPEQLETLYGDKLGHITEDTKAEAITAIVDDAESKTRDWYKNAKRNHKPMTAGPSGHTLGYINTYRDAYDRDEADPNKPVEAQHGFVKPNLEEARLVMLASLIGVKEHHSYDEVMVASQGIESAVKPHPGNSLNYIRRSNYADLWGTNTHGRAEAAALAARRDVADEYRDNDAFRDVYLDWYLKVIR